MADPVLTDKDVIALVRKEFERKIADFCQTHGIEPDEMMDNDDEEMDDEEEEIEDNPMGKRNPPKGKKPENIDINAIGQSIGLRVVHRDSGLEYYVRNISPARQMVDLETPEGTLFQVDFTELEQDYKLG